MVTQRTPESLDDVRLTIFRVHTQLAQLLDALDEEADAVLAGAGNAHALRAAISALHARFGKHLELEESRLVRWLPRNGAGPVHVLGDRADQRARMDGLVHDRDVFGDPRTVAREARAFTRAFRKELAEEDVRLRALG